MECESRVSRSIIDEFLSSEIQGDQMVGKGGVTRSITDELLFPYIQGVQMEGKSGVTGSIIHKLHSSDIEGDQMVVKVVLLEVSLMNFIPGISKEMKW